MKILTLPLKLFAKLSLYILYAIVALVGIVILFISTAARAIFRVISVFLFIIVTIALIAAHNMESVEQLGMSEIIFLYSFIVLLFLLPIFGEFLSEKILYVSYIIKDFAEFPLIRRREHFSQHHAGESESTASSPNTTNSNSGFNLFDGITTIKELDKRYKILARCYHPDVAVGSSEEATKAMQYINIEYNVIKSRLL